MCTYSEFKYICVYTIECHLSYNLKITANVFIIKAEEGRICYFNCTELLRVIFKTATLKLEEKYAPQCD